MQRKKYSTIKTILKSSHSPVFVTWYSEKFSGLFSISSPTDRAIRSDTYPSRRITNGTCTDFTYEIAGFWPCFCLALEIQVIKKLLTDYLHTDIINYI